MIKLIQEVQLLQLHLQQMEIRKGEVMGGMNRLNKGVKVGGMKKMRDYKKAQGKIRLRKEG